MKERLLYCLLPLLFWGFSLSAQIQNGDFEWWSAKYIPHKVHYPTFWEVNRMATPMPQQPVDSVRGVSGKGLKLLQVEEGGEEYLGIAVYHDKIDYHPAYLSLDLQWHPTNDSTEALVYVYMKHRDTTEFDTTEVNIGFTQVILSDSVSDWTHYKVPLDYFVNYEHLQANYFFVYLIACLDREKTGMGSELWADNVAFEQVMSVKEYPNKPLAIDEVLLYDLRGRVVFRSSYSDFSLSNCNSVLSKGIYILEYREKGVPVKREKQYFLSG